MTALCLKVSQRAITDAVLTVDPTAQHKRAHVLTLMIMMAAGHFVGKSLPRWEDLLGIWEGPRHYLRNTNLDVITAEAIVWITFLMGRFWKADQRTDHRMFQRVGFATVSKASQIALGIIQSTTGSDFEAGATASRKLYVQSMEDRKLVEAFASVVLRSVGCQSLAQPRRAVGFPPPPEFIPISVVVNVFFASIPSAYYDTYKNTLREWSDRFPVDEDFKD